jgi:hypothetical protein
MLGILGVLASISLVYCRNSTAYVDICVYNTIDSILPSYAIYFKKVDSLRNSRLLPPLCSHPCSSPAPRVCSSLLACVIALDRSNRPVLRINLIAAVAPCLVPRTSFRSLAFSPSSPSLSLLPSLLLPFPYCLLCVVYIALMPCVYPALLRRILRDP